VEQTEIIDFGIKPGARNIRFHSSGYTTGMTEVAVEHSFHNSGYTTGMTEVAAENPFHSSGYTTGMTEVAAEHSLS
jgi:hypothetical protein